MKTGNVTLITGVKTGLGLAKLNGIGELDLKSKEKLKTESDNDPLLEHIKLLMQMTCDVDDNNKRSLR